MLNQVLWPYLLEFLVQETYTNAISALCQNLCYLAGKQRERDSVNFTIDFVEMGMLTATSLLDICCTSLINATTR